MDDFYIECEFQLIALERTFYTPLNLRECAADIVLDRDVNES